MLELYFETYGCTANYNSTEIIKGLVKQAGFNITSNIDYADLVVINSCIVKEPTEEKIRRRIFDFLKKNKKIILAGCMPRINEKKLQHENLFLLDTSHVKNIINLIQDIRNKTYDSKKYLKQRNEIKLNLPKVPKEKFIGITQISEGCFGECAYCIVRLAKGKLFSYPKDKIIKSIEQDLQAGCKEIWLTSQDNASYGNDEANYRLPNLMKEILKLKHNFFIRLGMMEPNNILKILPEFSRSKTTQNQTQRVLPELIEIYKNKKIFKFLHIPVQSGSNKILKEMRRKYTKEDVLKIISEFRKEFPEMHISTDVIVGFPGETEQDFEETFELIKEIKPETINVSKFCPRPQTSAARMNFQIDVDIKKQRAIKIMQLHKQICEENQKKFLNTLHKVLVDQIGWPGTYLARDENYKLFAILSREKILGKKVEVKVNKVTPHYLIGKLFE